jgi:hypothetical protein
MIACLKGIVAFATSLVLGASDLCETDISLRYSEISVFVARADLEIHVVYHKATCKGEKLLAATIPSHDPAADYISPIDSPWTNAIQ